MARRESNVSRPAFNMNWIKITTEDLECALNKPQLEILKAQALRSPERDIAFDVISNIVARMRAEIAASGLNSLDADHSKIPPELKETAIRLCVEALQLRVPSIEISNSQIKHADIARETMSRVAKGELPVCRPTYSIKTASIKKGFYANASKREMSRKLMKGL